MPGRAAHYLRQLRGVVGPAIAGRRHYRTPFDALKAAAARLALTPRGRRLLGQRTITLRLRGDFYALHLRLGTTDFQLVEEIFEHGEYAPAAAFTLPDASKGGGVVLDLGANIGLATRYFDRRHPSAHFIAVEPDFDNLRLLEINCRHLFDAGRLQTFHGFVAARDGYAAIDRTGGAWAIRKTDPGIAPEDHPTTGNGGAVELIPCLSVPTLLDRAGVDRVDLLKCDIEGSEAELFADCAAWIGRVDHLIVETHRPYTPADLYRHLTAAGATFDITHEHPAGQQHVCYLTVQHP